MLHICVFGRNVQSYDAEQLSRLSVVENTHCQFAPNSLKISFVANSFSWLYRHGALLSARKVLASIHSFRLSRVCFDSLAVVSSLGTVFDEYRFLLVIYLWFLFKRPT